ncbi:MarR family winged helix-turn-helix transcriptional regulator [Clostridium sp. FAM 1755]|uniref:MarR family transcriptional regulator n=2 Tax=Clostridium TaxID=1485 RepID=A0A6M0T3R1_CLOBO|nr:MarR family winged helix-turn-helix transcriptional regulator [Clostridium sporogenes]NFA62003.1 MarR family transcriptional regulator [Clostridium botulinum]MDS1003416.1 MarR family winged helix-turn-helix transcriptional regulator [Clostridium sporogenes]NFI72198.1 winged helix-turn-helix transcriptional regulator [Clostridium sporogenes]NFL73908.1 winged helix-turn-helix transcriptional regulator [Clostridium sporogenes]NFM23736.1 winged helix-turn-helix transcriptional regulator [Clostr
MGNETQCIGKYISMLYRAGNSYINKELFKYGIGSGQYIFLLYLLNNNGCNQEEISTALNIDKGTTARALQKLEKEGYISKKIDKDDRRINHILVTEKAIEVKEIIIEALRSWQKTLYSDFTEREKKELLKLLEKASLNCHNNKYK